MSIAVMDFPHCCGVIFIYNFFDSVGNYRTDSDNMQEEIEDILMNPAYSLKASCFVCLNPYNAKAMEEFLLKMGFKPVAEGIGQHDRKVITYVLNKKKDNKFIYESLYSWEESQQYKKAWVEELARLRQVYYDDNKVVQAYVYKMRSTDPHYSFANDEEYARLLSIQSKSYKVYANFSLTSWRKAVKDKKKAA